MKRFCVSLCVLLVSTILACGQSAKDDLERASGGHLGDYHSTTEQHSSSGERGGGESRSRSGGDTSAQVSVYNHNIDRIRKSSRIAHKGLLATEKGRWTDALKLYEQAIKNLPNNFNGGRGSEEQRLSVERKKAVIWRAHAYCVYKMGNLENAMAEFQWVANDDYADADEVHQAQVSVSIIQNELDAAAIEKKKQVEQAIAAQEREANRSAYGYFRTIDEFDVENNPRYAVAANGDTYCNVFAQDVTTAMGAPLPKFTANGIYLWLNDPKKGGANGWKKFTAGAAQANANDGHPTIAIWRNPSGPHGHIAIVRPGSVGDSRGIAEAQSGSLVLNATHLVDGFNDPSFKKSVEYWSHR